MPEYKLHYFPESGNSYKLALMLTLCGKTFEPIWTDFGSGITWTPAWREAVNPMGEIPVLVEDGISLTQTAPILLRLADKFARFQGTSDIERYEVKPRPRDQGSSRFKGEAGRGMGSSRGIATPSPPEAAGVSPPRLPMSHKLLNAEQAGGTSGC